ncbi:MAG: hypothetical protein OQK53_04220, partial [Rhodospirillales bacterium]|nr:hypothetical protein [Rhodospirillales bacterium]
AALNHVQVAGDATPSGPITKTSPVSAEMTPIDAGTPGALGFCAIRSPFMSYESMIFASSRPQGKRSELTIIKENAQKLQKYIINCANQQIEQSREGVFIAPDCS